MCVSKALRGIGLVEPWRASPPRVHRRDRPRRQITLTVTGSSPAERDAAVQMWATGAIGHLAASTAEWAMAQPIDVSSSAHAVAPSNRRKRMGRAERASCQKGNEFISMVGFLAMSRQRAGRAVAAAIAALLLAACGGSPQASVDPGARPELPVAEAAVANQLPKVTVWDVGEKQWVQFGNFLPADKPVLVWFWAPH